ncbi:MAG: DUF551 domain-containing protein [bacterium]|nr:DUF551 domain-containing protein [bacterium]
MADWQPIATAPKDQTIVMIWHEGPKSRGCVIAFCEHPENRDNFQVERWVTGNGSGWHLRPTHWMPLPGPPEASDA